MTIKYVRKLLWQRKIYFRIYTLSKVTFPHTSLLSGGYNFAYNHTQKHTRGIFLQVGIFLTVTPVGLVSQVRRLSAGAALKASCSTGEVKPKAPKKEPESSVCSLSHIGDL